MTRKRYESVIQATILAAFSRGLRRLFRNFVGGVELHDGTRATVGIGGKGGADLIGWSTVEITPDMVGQKVAVFCAIEVKRKHLQPSRDQARFLKLVKDAGGRAGVADSLPKARRIMEGRNA